MKKFFLLSISIGMAVSAVVAQSFFDPLAKKKSEPQKQETVNQCCVQNQACCDTVSPCCQTVVCDSVAPAPCDSVAVAPCCN